MTQLSQTLIWGGTAAILILLSVWVKQRGRLRSTSRTEAAELVDRRLETCIQKAKDKFAGRIPVVETDCFRGSSYHDPLVISIWYIVEQIETEKELQSSPILSELENEVRTQLGLCGYIRETRAIVSVGVASRERLRSDGWEYYRGTVGG